MTTTTNTNVRRRAAASARLQSLAAVALLGTSLTSIAVRVRAGDPDCAPKGPDAPASYTGYSLKVGTDCAQYVYCRDGAISSWHTCPNGLLFNGAVGVDGICDWAANTQCKDDSLEPQQQRPQLGNGGDSAAAAGSGPGQQAKEGAGEAAAETTTTTTTTTPEPTRQPTPQPQVLVLKQMAPQLTQLDNDGGDDGPGQNPDGPDDGAANPFNYFCGTSPEDAAALCLPCPGGGMKECAGDFTHGCFKGIISCASPPSAVGSGQADADPDEIADALADNVDAIVDGYMDATGNYAASPADPADPDASTLDVSKVPFDWMVEGPAEGGGADAPAPGAEDAPPPPDSDETPIPSRSPSLPPWTNAPFVPSPNGNQKTVIGYYASWQWYDREKLADPTNIDFTKYSRINYAFFQPDESGNLYGTDEWADPQLLWGPYVYDQASNPDAREYCSWDAPDLKNCNYHDTAKGLIYLAHAAGAEVMPSIGGWTLSDNFPGIAASPHARDRFAAQCVELIKAYDFDGIDIDWEYPGYEDHSGTPEDTVNFTLLLQAIREALDGLQSQTGKFYPLTAALPCGPDKIEKIQVAEIGKYLTEYNLMSYDMHGAWDALSGTNAPMFDQGWGDKSKRWSVHGCTQNYVELGVPLEKMNVGLPFYGRSVKRATGMKQFHDGADDVNWHLDEGSPQYFNIVDNLKRMTSYRHTKTQTQFAVFDNEGGGLVSYDDPRAICDKVHYANERGMHGFLIWEISGDMIQKADGRIITPLVDVTNEKINNPSFDCATLRDPLWALKDGQYRFAPPEPDSVDWSLYVPPDNLGSDNDFSGAQDTRPPPPAGGGDNYDTSANAVYVPPSDAGAAGNGGNAPADDGAAGGGKSQPEGDGDCPPDYTGYFPTAGCKGYAYCEAGQVVGASLPCVPGTLFDLTITACQFAANVQCGGASDGRN